MARFYKFTKFVFTNCFDATFKLNQITRHKLQSSIYKTNVTLNYFLLFYELDSIFTSFNAGLTLLF